jgi:hypothetical protein
MSRREEEMQVMQLVKVKQPLNLFCVSTSYEGYCRCLWKKIMLKSFVLQKFLFLSYRLVNMW